MMVMMAVNYICFMMCFAENFIICYLHNTCVCVCVPLREQPKAMTAYFAHHRTLN